MEFSGALRIRNHIILREAELAADAAKDNEIKGYWFDIERIEKLESNSVELKARYTGADIAPPSSTNGLRA